MLRTQLCIFDANRFAEGVPQVNEVGDDHAFALLRGDLLRQQGCANASLDARDLRLCSPNPYTLCVGCQVRHRNAN